MAASKLIKAIQSGKLPAVRAAIAAGESVRQPRTEPPLTIAAAKGHLAIVKELLTAGAKASATDSMGRQALVYAKTPQVAKALLEAGADPDQVSKWGNAALHVAAANGKTAYAKVLLAHGAKVDVRDKEGQTPLMKGAWHGKTEFVKLLLAYGADVNATDPDGKTALLKIAGKGGAPKIAKLLLKAGANINHASDHGTALGNAAYWRDWSLFQYLLKAGADVNVADKHGCTPLLSAVRIEDFKIATALVKAGADWSQQISKKHSNKQIAGRTIAEIVEFCQPPFRNKIRPLVGKSS